MTFKRMAINAMAMAVLIALFIVLIKLGLWQLDSAIEKEARLGQRQQAMNHTLFYLPNNVAELVQGQRVTLRGTLDFSRTLLLDNQIYRGVVGYEVLVPMKLNNEWIVLVNLGWIASGINRDELPRLMRWSVNEVTGFVHLPQLNPFITQVDSERDDGFPKRITQLDIDKVKLIFNQSFYPAIVRLTPKSDWGYTREWRWNNRMTPDKHRGYAIQWFALAGTLLILSGIFIWRLNRKSDD